MNGMPGLLGGMACVTLLGCADVTGPRDPALERPRPVSCPGQATTHTIEVL